MAVIIPCAGRSSRYPNMRPKYLLTLPDGKLMIEKVVERYPEQDKHLIILKEHSEKYEAELALSKAFKDLSNLHIHVLENVTGGPSETVYNVSKDLDESIFIVDCDSLYDAPYRKDNYVCVADLRKNLHLSNVAAKSFVQVNDQMMITNIVEKNVIGNYFCVGGYGFASSIDFNKAFEELKSSSEEIFVSHVIKKVLVNKQFTTQEVEDFVDLGTYREFKEYTENFACYFVDLDGTLFYNQSKYFSDDYSNKPTVIQEAVEYFLNKMKQGNTIVFTTARPSEYRDITLNTLREIGFEGCQLIMDLPHSPRVLVNDYAKSNPYPSARSINVSRDNGDFWSKM